MDSLHGRQVPDPYRWLEDPDSAETQAFVAAQNELTQSALARCRSREPFKKFFRQLYDYEKFGCPYKRGSRWGPCPSYSLQAILPLSSSVLPAAAACCARQ